MEGRTTRSSPSRRSSASPRSPSAEGISKIRLTGGEPLVRHGVVEHVRRLRAIDGHRGDRAHHQRHAAAAVRRASCARRASSASTSPSTRSTPTVYAQITRGGKLADALAGLDAAFEAGIDPVKLNVVVVRSLEQDLLGFAKMTLDRPLHVRFIEYMPVGDAEEGVGLPLRRQRRPRLDARRTPCPATRSSPASRPRAPPPVSASCSPVERDDAPGGWGPARYYRFAGAPGTVGVISPLSHHFCGECNRLRLTADGQLRPCLFCDDELDVRTVLRTGTDDDVRAVDPRGARAPSPRATTMRIGTDAPHVPDRRLNDGRAPASSRTSTSTAPRAWSTSPTRRSRTARAVAGAFVEMAPATLDADRRGQRAQGRRARRRAHRRHHGRQAHQRPHPAVPPAPAHARERRARPRSTLRGRASASPRRSRPTARPASRWRRSPRPPSPALTIYDMCKAVDRGMVIIGRARCSRKEGGKSGHLDRERSKPNERDTVLPGPGTRHLGEPLREEDRAQDARRARARSCSTAASRATRTPATGTARSRCSRRSPSTRWRPRASTSAPATSPRTSRPRASTCWRCRSAASSASATTAVLEISQIGKVCHTKCAIYYQAGDCVMPREGVFAVVREAGDVARRRRGRDRLARRRHVRPHAARGDRRVRARARRRSRGDGRERGVTRASIVVARYRPNFEMTDDGKYVLGAGGSGSCTLPCHLPETYLAQ